MSGLFNPSCVQRAIGDFPVARSIQDMSVIDKRVNQMPGAAGVALQPCKVCGSRSSCYSANSAARCLGFSRQTFYRKLRD
jgi:hypothetical protein